MLLCKASALFAAAPSDVHFVWITSDSARVAWTLGSAGDVPYYQYSTYPDLTLAPQQNLAAGDPGVNLAGLVSNATYYFRVGYNGEYSAVVSSASDPALVHGVVVGTGTTSVALSWTGQSNLSGTLYMAELAVDEGFIASYSTINASGYTFTGLNSDTTYFMQVKTLGVIGKDSDYLQLAPVVTLAYPPGAAEYALVSSDSLSVIWASGGNPEWTRYYVEWSTNNFVSVNGSSLTASTYYRASGLAPDTTHYFRALARNGAGIDTAQTVFQSTVTAAAPPAAAPPAFGSPSNNSLPVQWSPNNNQPDTQYFLAASTAPDFSGAYYGPNAWFTGASRNVDGLDSSRTFYFRVKARNREGRETAWFNLGSYAMPAGPDITPPTILDMQGGDDTWRGSSSGYYKVHFNDFGAGLDKFQVRAATGPGFTGTVAADWTDAVTAINSDSYTTDWQLPAAVFNAIPQGATCYISVRVYDKASVPNVSVSSDVFYVLRDTGAPVVTDNQASPSGWLSSDPGAVFDVDFADGLSGLRQIYYSVSLTANSGNASKVDWTLIDSFVSSAAYTAPWGLNFSALENGASNYVSVKAVDAAGNTTLLKDVFRLLKNTVGPNVIISVPGGAQVSTVTAFAGTTSPMNEVAQVAAVEISLRDLASATSFYYDGAAFASASAVWLPAAGLASWSYNASTVPLAANNLYQLKARARDIYGLETVTPARNFEILQVVPTVALSTPVAGSTVAWFNSIAGTASDGGGAGLGPTEVYIKRLSDSKWWNFQTDSWGTTMVASATLAAANWTFTPGAALRGALAHNQQYFVTARALDASVPPNVSAYAAPGATFTCVDTMAPQQTVSISASSSPYPGRIDLAWTFPGDDGGALPIPFGQYAVQYATFSGFAYSTASAQVLIPTGTVVAGGQQRCEIPGLAPEATYYLVLWTADDAGLWSPVSVEVNSVSGHSLDNQISGTVKMPSGAGVSGIIVEAYTNAGAFAASAYTLDDGLGTFTLSGLADGFYRVQAAWAENEFESSVAKDLIPMGYADTNFVLATEYLLAEVSGSVPSAVRGGSRPSSAAGGLVQLWRNGRQVAETACDAAGNFAIRNLLPGKYTLKVQEATGEWRTFSISLAPGQALQVSPLGAALVKSQVYAYPNPAQTRVTFHAESGVLPATAEISVFSLDGTLVKHAEGPVPGSKIYEYTWDFSGGNPASGVYFYTVRVKNDLSGETGRTTRKFAVVR